MTALTQAALIVRRLFTLSLFLGAATLITFLFWTLGKPVWRSFFPEPTPAPTVAFGKLPSMTTAGFPLATNSAGTVYKIDTVEGSVPNLAPQAKVFPIAKQVPSLLLYERAKQKASKMGFAGGPIIITETVRKFFDKANPQRTITMNMINGNFIIDTPKNEWQKFSSHSLLIEEKAKELAKSFLSNHGFLYPDLKDEKFRTTSLKITQDQFGNLTLREAVSPPEEVDFVRVDFYRNDIEKIPIVPLEDNKANISLIVSPKLIESGSYNFDKNQTVVLASYTYWPFDPKTFATYPLKPVSDAFQELQKGQGIVLTGKDKEVSIRKIYLAYLEEKGDAKFLQPVFVFEGQNTQKAIFQAVVPAVQKDFIE